MIPRDTTPEAAAVQEEAYRRLGASGRFRIALELTNFTRRLAIAGMLRRHPEYTEQQAVEALARELYGPR